MSLDNVLINHRTQGKGVEAVHLQGIAGGMRDCGLKGTIISPPGVEVSTKDVKKGAARALARYAPQILFELLELLSNLAAFRSLERAKREQGCDIIYDRYAFLGISAYWAARLWGVPLVVEVNYLFESDLSLRSRSRIFGPLTRACERRVFRQADLLLPVSSKLKDDLIRLGYDQKKILVSPNAVDLSYFPRYSLKSEGIMKKLNISPTDTVIGFVGSFAPWHRVDILLDACTKLTNTGDHSITLLLIGDGATRAEMEQAAKRLPPNIKATFTGFVPHDELAGHISVMDIAVMPHSNDYGSPMKVFEYMALGKAVVAPDFSPLRDAINDGDDGLLFPPEDAEDLKDKLALLISEDRLRESIGKQARERVENEHNWKSRCGKILQQLQTIGIR